VGKILKHLSRSISSFILLGIFLVLIAVGMLIFSWLLIAGAITGLILYVLAWIQARFLHRRSQALQKKPENHGRTFENDRQ